MSFAEDDDMVETSRRIEPISRSVWPFCQRSRRGRPITNGHGAKPPLEYLAVDAVAIAEDVPRRRLPAAGLGKLPRDPARPSDAPSRPTTTYGVGRA